MTTKALKKEVNSAYCRYGHSLWRGGLCNYSGNTFMHRIRTQDRTILFYYLCLGIFSWDNLSGTQYVKIQPKTLVGIF